MTCLSYTNPPPTPKISQRCANVFLHILNSHIAYKSLELMIESKTSLRDSYLAKTFQSSSFIIFFYTKFMGKNTQQHIWLKCGYTSSTQEDSKKCVHHPLQLYKKKVVKKKG